MSHDNKVKKNHTNLLVLNCGILNNKIESHFEPQERQDINILVSKLLYSKL